MKKIIEYDILKGKKYKNIYKNESKIFTVLIKTTILFLLYLLLFFLNKYKCINNTKENVSILQNRSNNDNVFNLKFKIKLKHILEDNEIFENEIMSKHTTFKIGGPAKFFLRPKTSKQIIGIIKLCNKYKINYFILGNGSNLLVSDKGYYGVIIQIKENNFSELKVIKENEINYLITVGGGMLMKTLSIEACFLSLTGLEDIIDIPGTIGGGIIMNASFRGNGLSENLIKVTAITSKGEIKELTKKECGFYHRGSLLKEGKYIVIEAIFKLKKGDQMIIQKKMTNNTKNRYKKQPMYFGSAGCFFIWNHTENGSLYSKYKESNLVGYRIGNIMIYTYNISFIVNLGKGTASQVMEIVEYITKIIKEKYNIEIKKEVIIIGSINGNDYY